MAFLEHAQQLHLDAWRDIADFIKKNGPLVGQFEFPRLAGSGPGKRAFFVSKQFTFQQVFRDRRAIDLDERTGSAARVLVNGPGDQVFAHTALAAQQDGGVGGCHPAHRRQYLLHPSALGHNVPKLVTLSQRLA